MHIEIPELKRIIKFYGEQAQTVIFCEECAELIQAISKNYRARHFPATFNERENARNNLTEEISDVLMVIREIQELYDISDYDLQEVIAKKYKRQEERINAEINRRNCGREER